MQSFVLHEMQMASGAGGRIRKEPHVVLGEMHRRMPMAGDGNIAFLEDACLNA